MRLLVDAQLPRRLARLLSEAGHDTLHTFDLPSGNRTRDRDIVDLCAREQRVLVTKDADFVDSFWLLGLPPKLLLISTGNITNRDLESLLFPQAEYLVNAFDTHDFIELTRSSLLIHK